MNEQGWTPKYVASLMKLASYVRCGDAYKRVSDAHNAAVTAHEQAWVRALQKIGKAYAQDVLVLQLELAAEREKVRDLEAWKKSALSVSPPLQEIGRELGLTIGESVHDKILPAIKLLKSQQREYLSSASDGTSPNFLPTIAEQLRIHG